MVLITARAAAFSLVIASVLSACTHLQPADDNRLPESKVIPVTQQPTHIDKPAPVNKPPAQQIEPDTLRDSKTSADTRDSGSQSSIENSAAPKKSEVLDSILQQARKAIDNEQWLRAQHHLEHALRISPQHAQTFYLYALVYQGLGIPEKATQMLKRSLFLSRPDSDLHQTVKQELEAQSQ